LNALKMVPEVCRIFCATANPTEVVIAQTEQGRGILRVVDGASLQGRRPKPTSPGARTCCGRSVTSFSPEGEDPGGLGGADRDEAHARARCRPAM
jgi:adenosine specific kinase